VDLDGLVDETSRVALGVGGHPDVACRALRPSERTDGGTRQLRVTPLSPGAYLRAKVLTGYAMALLTIALPYTAGDVLGVRLPAERLEMTGLILIGLLPFAALGVLVGHLLTADPIGPANGGLVSLLALVSGTWFPLGDGLMHDVAHFLPRTGSCSPATSRSAARLGPRPAGA
jgi:hypothetical protein